MNPYQAMTLPLPDRSEAQALLARIATATTTVASLAIDRPLVLYGAGNLGQLAARLLAYLGIPVAYALDRSPPKNGLLTESVPVFAPDQVPAADRQTHLLAVCTVMTPYVPVADDLAGQGWRHIRPFYDVADRFHERVPLNNGWFAGSLDTEDREHLADVLNGWHDDISRAAHLQCLAWRVHREEWTFPEAPVTTNDRYFIPPVHSALTDEERFLDGGAWQGKVGERFIELTGGRFREVVAIEPDLQNLGALRAWRSTLPADQLARVRILDSALGRSEAEAAFAQGHDLASRLMPGASATVKVRTLDTLDIDCSFAKLHLEGGELDAIEGGLNWLNRRRPLLAVTVYHNRDGLWRIPAVLMQNLADYRFLFRLHAWAGTGAVLYALPNERAKTT